MGEIKLDLLEILNQRMKEAKPLIQIIQGPRQVGKTTLLQQFFDLNNKKTPIHFVSGDEIVSPTWIKEQWQLASDSKKILIIDEVQKIPNWSETIKKLWDSDKTKKKYLKCILTGSSSLNLQKGMSESLTGRFELVNIYHWNYKQSYQLSGISLDNYLKFGGYPGSYKFIKNQKRWVNYLTNSIVETVIGKDILMLAQVKSPALFKQSFYLLSSYPAQVISYNKLLGQLQDKGNIDLVKYYIELFEGAFLLKTIQKFSYNEHRKKTSSPKIIMLAPALSTFHRINNLKLEDYGRIFESIVGAELIKNDLNPTYWAEGDYEVDFIVEYKNRIIAIEVKSGRTKKTASLDVFLKKYPTANIIFITKDNFQKFSLNPILFIENALA